MITDAKWIKAPTDTGAAVVAFRRKFSCKKPIGKGVICISAIGVFKA